MAGAEGLGLACRLGRRFCFAEVSTGDPRPSTRSARLGFKNHLHNIKNKTDTFRYPFHFLWQGQKDLNPRHAVLEHSLLSLFINGSAHFRGTKGAHLINMVLLNYYKLNIDKKCYIWYFN